MAEPRPKLTGRQWAGRIGIALLVGTALTGTAILAAWQGLAPAYPLNSRQFWTRLELVRIGNALANYLNDNGSLPLRLTEPNEVSRMGIRTDSNSAALDEWGHPLIYQRDGNTFVVTSLGRDGKPGGMGLDCDISTSAPWPPDAHPTLEQFLFEMPTAGMIWSSAFSGLLATILTLVVLRTPRQGASGKVIIAGKMVFTIIGAAVVAFILTMLHIPSGH